jgi:hypothetical protein
MDLELKEKNKKREGHDPSDYSSLDVELDTDDFIESLARRMGMDENFYEKYTGEDFSLVRNGYGNPVDGYGDDYHDDDEEYEITDIEDNEDEFKDPDHDKPSSISELVKARVAAFGDDDEGEDYDIDEHPKTGEKLPTPTVVNDDEGKQDLKVPTPVVVEEPDQKMSAGSGSIIDNDLRIPVPKPIKGTDDEPERSERSSQDELPKIDSFVKRAKTNQDPDKSAMFGTAKPKAEPRDFSLDDDKIDDEDDLELDDDEDEFDDEDDLELEDTEDYEDEDDLELEDAEDYDDEDDFEIEDDELGFRMAQPVKKMKLAEPLNKDEADGADSKKGRNKNEFSEINVLTQNLENMIEEMQNLCIDTEELEDIVEEAKESQEKNDFYNSKKLLEKGLNKVQEYKANYLAINLSDMISTTHLRITRIDAPKKERDELLAKIKKGKKFFMKKKYEKTERVLEEINLIIDKTYKELEPKPLPPIEAGPSTEAEPLPEGGGPEPAGMHADTQNRFNDEIVSPELPPGFEKRSKPQINSGASSAPETGRTEEIDLTSLTKLDDLDMIFNLDEEFSPEVELSDEKIFELEDIEKTEKPNPISQPSRSQVPGQFSSQRTKGTFETQALDGIQTIQSIITSLHNYGVDTVILERLSDKAKSAFKNNDFEAIRGYVLECEEVSKKLKIGYMQSLLSNINVSNEELGYLEYLIQQTEEANYAGDKNKAEEFGLKYKELIIDLMKNNGQPDQSSRNFEFCRFCGESVPIESTFCSKCGEKLR